jgi:hypothetical protein
MTRKELLHIMWSKVYRRNEYYRKYHAGSFKNKNGITILFYYTTPGYITEGI